MSRSKRRKRLRVVGYVLVVVLAVATAFVTIQVLNKSRADVKSEAFTPAPIVQPDLMPVALWVGDSYTEGTGADGFVNSYASLVSRRLGYLPVPDAQGGTGFVNDGKDNAETNVPVSARLSKIKTMPALVVIDAGRNDGKFDFETKAKPAALAYLDAVQAKWPEARLVLIVPHYTGNPGQFGLFARFYAEEAKRLGAEVVDPIAEDFYRGHKLAALVYEDKIHPNKQGHAILADKLTTRFKALGLAAP